MSISLRQWNSDKPHRCPQCHRVWTYVLFAPDGRSKPQWWKIYKCPYCQTKFSGLGWEEGSWWDFPLVFWTHMRVRRARWAIDDFTARIPRRTAFRLTQLAYYLYDPTFKQTIEIKENGITIKAWNIVADEYACGIDSSSGPDSIGSLQIVEGVNYD